MLEAHERDVRTDARGGGSCGGAVVMGSRMREGSRRRGRLPADPAPAKTGGSGPSRPVFPGRAGEILADPVGAFADPRPVSPSPEFPCVTGSPPAAASVLVPVPGGRRRAPARPARREPRCTRATSSRCAGRPDSTREVELEPSLGRRPLGAHPPRIRTRRRWLEWRVPRGVRGARRSAQAAAANTRGKSPVGAEFHPGAGLPSTAPSAATSSASGGPARHARTHGGLHRLGDGDAATLAAMDQARPADVPASPSLDLRTTTA